MTPSAPGTRLRPLLLGLLAVYVVALAVILFFPRGEMPSTVVWEVTVRLWRAGADPFVVTAARVEVVLNVLLMVPLAFLGRLLRPTYGWRDWAAVGFVVSLTVELLQGFLLPERSASALDVVANTAGVAIGAVLASALASLSGRVSRTSS